MGGDDMAEIAAEGLTDVENTVFVAVGKNVKESKTTLFWATNNFPGKKICLLHVHQTPHLISLVDEKFSIIKVKKMVVKTWREVEQRKMHRLLNQYLVILDQLGVQACKVWIEMESVDKGIIQVIAQYNVRRLVMGAAADEHYIENMSELKSAKATFVCQQAPDSCHIWFACNGHLIYARCGDGLFSMRKSVAFPSVTSGGDISLLHANADEVPDHQERMLIKSTTQNLLHSTRIEVAVEECKTVTETKQKQELEEVLDRQRQDLEEMKHKFDKYRKEIQLIRDQKTELEGQLMRSRSIQGELDEKTTQAVNLLVTFKEKRDQLQIQCDDITRQNEELKKLIVGDTLQFFDFSFSEINEATKEFDSCMKIGDGRYGSVYKGFLQHRKIAIKMLPSHGCQDYRDFENEVKFLCKVRHPNLVSVVGISSETRSLIYEFLEKGSLEDRIICRGKTSPLSWQTRMKIASEICSALIFLHSNRPSLIHGNLKPTNILLDANYNAKICDTGLYSLVPKDFQTTYLTSLCNGDNLEASAYVAPEVFETGEVTPKSDVYSLGVVLLRLLTGRTAIGVLENVKCALEMGNLSSVLDLGAGKWPIDLAERLVRLALRCCEIEQEHRADLVLDVVNELELLKKSCDSSDLDSKEPPPGVPSHFLCPIFQEIMKDPQIALDGFTYEGDAIKGWFNSGHSTSPMTNLKLQSCDLLPNYALYNAIQEWEQQC